MSTAGVSTATGATFVLVHSPLVGPATWEPAADVLRSRGHRAVVPSLLGTLDAGPPYVARQVDAVAAAVRAAAPDGTSGPGTPGQGHGGYVVGGQGHGGYVVAGQGHGGYVVAGQGHGGYVVAGHSGAGPLLPAIGAALGALGPVRGYLFVDAAPPRPGRSWWDVAPPETVESIEGMAQDGWVPPWHEWFPPEELAAELPTGRDRVVGELRRLPLAMFTEPAPVVPGWPDAPCGYLRLAPAYDGVLTLARDRGWRSASLDGRHLSLYSDPARVVDAMLGLLG